MYQADDTKMELRTIAILVLMATIVLLTSAFGAYQDGIEKQKEHEFDMKKKAEKAGKAADNPSTLVGASGAGTSYKQSAAHLDVSEKVDMPYVKDQIPTAEKLVDMTSATHTTATTTVTATTVTATTKASPRPSFKERSNTSKRYLKKYLVNGKRKNRSWRR